MPRKSRAANKIDAMIEDAYRETCSGIEIAILDIPKVFQAARQALAEGKDLKESIRSFVETIRLN